MQDTELYYHLSGIEAPWHIAKVERDLTEEAVYVYVDFGGREASFRCPECGQYANLCDRRETRRWRHLDGLLAYIRHRVTNALAENLNGQIQRVKTNAGASDSSLTSGLPSCFSWVNSISTHTIAGSA